MDSRNYNQIERDNPKVSVIMPIYNGMAYLERALDSVRKQTYINLEIILVDDGSNDGSEIYCDRMAEEDMRIRVLHQQNGGVSSARNSGLEAAKGDYIAFVDSDDYIEPFMYERLVRKLQCEKCQAAVCNSYVEEENGDSRLYFDNMQEQVLTGEQAIIHMHYLNQMNTELWNKLCARQLWKDVQFQEGLKIGEDYKALVEIFLKTEKIAVVPEPAYHYIQRKSGAMANGYIKAGEQVDCLFMQMKEKEELKEGELYKSTVCFCDTHLLTILMEMIRSNSQKQHQKRVEAIRQSLKKTFSVYKKEKSVPFHFRGGAFLFILNRGLFVLFSRWFYRKPKKEKAANEVIEEKVVNAEKEKVEKEEAEKEVTEEKK